MREGRLLLEDVSKDALFELTKAVDALVNYKLNNPEMYRDGRIARCISELIGLQDDVREKVLSLELLLEIKSYSKEIYWGIVILINTNQYDALEKYTERFPQIYRMVAAE